MSTKVKIAQLVCLTILLVTALTALSAAQPSNTPLNDSNVSNTTQSAAEASVTDDDNPRNATAIPINETVNGKLPVGDQDWNVFTLDYGGPITLSVTAGDNTNMSAFLYSREGMLESSYVSPGERVTLTTTVSSGGDYFVFVRNEASATNGTYTFEVSNGDPESASSTERAKVTESANESGPGFGVPIAVGAVILTGYAAVRRN